MTEYIDNNTTTKNPTHFLRGVELVKKANKDFHLYTENWAYPTRYRYGNPKDRYYAEVWHDGMDWNSNYWLIESDCLIRPTVYPLIHFASNDDARKIPHFALEEIMEAIMHYRRETLWIKSDDSKGYFSDCVWPYIRLVEPHENLERCPCMCKYRMLHASQPRVEFYMNKDLVPEQMPVSNVIKNGNMEITSDYPVEEQKSGDLL